MAIYAAAANGNFSAGATWAAVDGTSFLDSEAASTVLTTSPVASSTFQPGAITVDGIAVKFLSRAASPSGTITAELYNSTSSVSVATVTINVSDITVPGLRVVRLSVSVASQISAYRNATGNNWSRYLRTTTTGVAPVAGDTLLVAGECTAAATMTTRTVTYDITANTSWGSPSTISATAIAVCHGGTLQNQTTASTAYVMTCAGNIEVMGNATWNFNSFASTSAFAINLASTGTVQGTGTLTATNYGLILTGQAAFNMVGNTVTNVSALLAADLSASGTAATTNISTGWAVGDVLAINATDQTYSHGEKVTLTSISGTSLGFAAVTNAHSGTSPNQAEVIKLNRSIVISGNATNGGYIQTNGTTAPFTFQYCEFTALGGSTSINIFAITNSSTGTKTIQYCSFHDTINVANANGIVTSSATIDNLTIDSNNFYNFKSTAYLISVLTTSAVTGITITNNISAGGSLTTGNGINVGVWIGTLSGNTMTVGAIGFNVAIGSTSLTMSNNLAHACGSRGWAFVAPILTAVTGAAQTITAVSRRCLIGFTVFSAGIISGVTWTLTAVGCSVAGGTLGSLTSSTGAIVNSTFLNCVFAGDSTFAQPIGFQFYPGFPVMNCTFIGCTLGVGTAHTTADVSIYASGGNSDIQAVFLDCNLASTGVEVVGQAFMTPASFLGHQAWKQTAASHRTHFAGGTVTYDTAIFGASSPAARLTPLSATVGSFSVNLLSLRCNSGAAVTCTLWIRTSVVGDGAAYNGSAPTIVQKANIALGITTDSVLATWSGVAGTGQTISFTTSSPTDDGVITIAVVCNGTAGWINVDDLIPS